MIDQIDRTIVLVFCIADVPVAALNDFLEQSEDAEYDSCCFRIMDDLDLDKIPGGHNPKNPLSDTFVSPFLGWTIKQVKKWFIANLKNKPRRRFVNCNFVIIDEYILPAEGENEQAATADAKTVILCDAQTKMFKTVRIAFSLVKLKVVSLDLKQTMREGALGVFWRSGTTCTREAYRMVSKNGMYFHKGIPERDEDWRAFAEEWDEDGPHDYESTTDSDSEAESAVLARDAASKEKP